MTVDPTLPGAEIAGRGLADLAAGQRTVEALVVRAAAPRLERLGLEVPDMPLARDAELELYALLVASGRPDAYSAYNGLLRRIDSFAAALEAREGRALRAASEAGSGPR